jgi:hypothetical protein
MEAFSDGVFAIAVTLLVLEIAVPAGSGDDLLGALGDQWPSYLGYLVSFATIGAVWFAHTVITEYMTMPTRCLMPSRSTATISPCPTSRDCAGQLGRVQQAGHRGWDHAGSVTRLCLREEH